MDTIRRLFQRCINPQTSEDAGTERGNGPAGRHAPQAPEQASPSGGSGTAAIQPTSGLAPLVPTRAQTAAIAPSAQFTSPAATPWPSVQLPSLFPSPAATPEASVQLPSLFPSRAATPEPSVQLPSQFPSRAATPGPSAGLLPPSDPASQALSSTSSTRENLKATQAAQRTVGDLKADSTIEELVAQAKAKRAAEKRMSEARGNAVQILSLPSPETPGARIQTPEPDVALRNTSYTVPQADSTP